MQRTDSFDEVLGCDKLERWTAPTVSVHPVLLRTIQPAVQEAHGTVVGLMTSMRTSTFYHQLETSPFSSTPSERSRFAVSQLRGLMKRAADNSIGRGPAGLRMSAYNAEVDRIFSIYLADIIDILHDCEDPQPSIAPPSRRRTTARMRTGQ